MKHLLRIQLWLLIMFGYSCHAQQAGYTSQSKGAIKSYEAATKMYDTRQNDMALKELETAIRRDSMFIEAYMLRAAIYADMEQYDNASLALRKAVEIHPTFFPNNFYSLGRFQMMLSQYDAAKKYFGQFVQMKEIGRDLKDESLFFIKCCDFAAAAMQHPVPFEPKNMGGVINTSANEYYPTMSIDGKLFLFTRSDNKLQGKLSQEDFYISEKKGDSWQTAMEAGSPLNTDQNEGAASMSADGKILFFTACNRPDGKGSCDIQFARKTTNGWSSPRNIGEPINTSAWETQPSFSADGKSLYFIRGVYDSNGKRQQDIYVSTLGDDGKFQQPTKLSNVINTDKSEESVFIHPDNRTLYFSSNGHIGMGGLDIYMSKKNDDGTWQTPVNLGYPINTSKDENSLMVSPDGMLGYFASDRAGSAGGLDMYEFPLPAAVKPLQLTYVKCNITDAETKLPLPARYEIVNAANGKIVKWANADKTDGSFLTPLSSGVNYSLNITHPGYLFYSDSFECAANANYEHPYILQVELQPLKTGASIVLKNVFFDTDKAELKTESHYELQKLITLLKENAALKIEVSGHTDNTGKKENNMTLSQNRAKAVMDYLTQNGIDTMRVTAKGYGDTTPCADNATDAGKALNRRTEIKIVK